MAESTIPSPAALSPAAENRNSLIYAGIWSLILPGGAGALRGHHAGGLVQAPAHLRCHGQPAERRLSGHAVVPGHRRLALSPGKVAEDGE